MNVKQTGLLMSNYGVLMKYFYTGREYRDLVVRMIDNGMDVRKTHAGIVSGLIQRERITEELQRPRISGIDETYFFNSRRRRGDLANFLLKSKYVQEVVPSQYCIAF